MLNKKYTVIFIAIALLFSVSAMSKDILFKVLSIKDVSSYKRDRIVYQQIEHLIDIEKHQRFDNSIATLLLIKNNKMYLFKDGYDNPKVVDENRIIREMENRLIYNTLWERKINGIPDYMRVTDRRVELLRKEVVPGQKEDIIAKPFVEFYQKTRDTFIKKHVAIFKGLMINRKDSNLLVIRKPIPKRLNYTGPTKFSITATAKTPDGKRYFAEDSDGDGITETMSVDMGDGFQWGFQSGPNILLIYHNKQEDIKKIIGNLAQIAYEGTPVEEKLILKQFESLDKEIPKLIDDLIIMDTEVKALIESANEKKK